MTKYDCVQGVVTPNGALHGTILEYSCNIGYRDTILPCLPRNRDHAFIIDYLKRNHIIVNRYQLIWQIEEFLYRHSIPGMIYHIRADAFRFFGL